MTHGSHPLWGPHFSGFRLAPRAKEAQEEDEEEETPLLAAGQEKCPLIGVINIHNNNEASSAHSRAI